MNYLIPAVLAIIGIILQITIAKTPLIETILQYVLIMFVGVMGILAFLGHTLKADEVARKIGWPSRSGFQFEVACANLSYGVLGILCIWFRGNFWIATAIAYSVFLLGAAYGHIREIVKKGNLNPYNAGWPLIMDIVKPVMLLILFVLYYIGK